MLNLICLLKMIILMFVATPSLHHGVEADSKDLCNSSAIDVTRVSESTTLENPHVWALGYYGKLYQIDHVSHGTLIVTIKNHSRTIYKWNITVEDESSKIKLILEPTKKNETQNAPFQILSSTPIVLEITHTASIGEFRFKSAANGLQVSWKRKDNICQFNIRVKECSYDGGENKPSVRILTNETYLQKGHLNCENSELFHVENETLHKNGAIVRCLSDATWSNADEYECWTKPTVELKGNLIVKENETLSLNCNQTGGYPNLDESTSLFYIGGRNVTGTTRVTYEDDTKKIYCKAHSNYTKFSNESMVKSDERELNVKYAPRGNETQNCTLRNDRTCYIDFRSNPKPENCSWIKGENATSFNVTTTVQSGSNRDHRCKLTFTGIDDKPINFTEVKIKVTSNEFPNHPFIVQLRATIVPISIETTTTTSVDTTTPNNGGEDTTPPPGPQNASSTLVVAIGVAGGAFLIAILIIGLCCVLKKRKKKASTEAPEEVNNELYGETNFVNNTHDGAEQTTNVLYGQVAGTQTSGEKKNPLYDTASSARTSEEKNNPLYGTASAAHTSEEKNNPLYDTATTAKGDAHTDKKQKKTKGTQKKVAASKSAGKKEKARPVEEKNNPLYDTASAAHTSEEKNNPLYDTATTVKGVVPTGKKKKKTKAVTLEEKNNPLYGTTSGALPTSEERNNPLYDTASKGQEENMYAVVDIKQKKVVAPAESDNTYAVITKKQKKAKKPAQNDDTYAEVSKKKKKVTTPAQSDDTYAVVTKKQKKAVTPAPSDDTYAVVTKKQKKVPNQATGDDTYAVVTKKQKKAVTPTPTDDTYAVVTKKQKKAVTPTPTDDTYAVVTKKQKKAVTPTPTDDTVVTKKQKKEPLPSSDDTYAVVQKSLKKNKP